MSSFKRFWKEMASTTASAEVTAVTKKDTDTEKPQIYDNTTGAQVVKGGQLYDDSFQDAIGAAYSNLTNSPLILTLYFFAVMVLITTVLGVPGPIEYLLTEVQQTAKTATWKPQMVVCKMLLIPIRFLNHYKHVFINISLLWVPYFMKPSQKNLYFCLAFSAILITVSAIGYVELFLMTQAWFLFTELRNPRYKFLIVLVPALLVLFAHMNPDVGPPPPVNTTIASAVEADERINQILEARDRQVELFNIQLKKLQASNARLDAMAEPDPDQINKFNSYVESSKNTKKPTTRTESATRPNIS